MSVVSVITDSAAALPASLAAEVGVTVVPMQVTLGEETRGSDEFDLETILFRLEEGIQTAAPSPGDFVTAIEDAPGDVVIATVASSMSSTYRSAEVASRLVDRPTKLVDTSTAAGAEGLVVLAAASAARQGADLSTVEAVARSVASRVRLVASVAGMDQLVRSGRVPQIAGWAGRRLGIRPLFEFRGGQPRPLRPATSRGGSIDRIFEQWRRTAVDGGLLHVVAMHACDLDGAIQLLEAVCDVVIPTSSFVGEFGPVMLAHTGPGLVGLAWYWD